MKKKPNKYIMVCSCFVIAAVCAVGISVSTADKELPNQEYVQLEEKNETAQVNLNKNAAPKIEEKKTVRPEKNETKQEKVPAEEKQTKEKNRYKLLDC